MVLTSLVLAHYSDVVTGDEGGAPMIWHNSIAEYVVIVLLRFFTAVHDDAVGVACIDPRLGGSGWRLVVLLPSCIPRKADDICLL